ncbi:gluconate 2-dehydrogenase subunit 3 family protein [Pedobacter immunditicola]|uniref:gluconate 2-dehydrogenase subunit 3 family protein n=1 Tax=Pedobacter immunditicola TaxID=3133440 RepID=UPI0030A6FF82
MERRLVIKQILIMAGGLALLPSCLRDAGKSSVLLKNLDVSLDQENLLAEIVETIIPKTSTPGAKELNIHLFVLKMLDDCYEPEEQQLFLKGLEALKVKTQDLYHKSFMDIAVPERQKLLVGIENDKEAAAELAGFYKIMKGKTIQGYLNSQYVMTNLIKWELVPGRYNGYYPVKTA